MTWSWRSLWPFGSGSNANTAEQRSASAGASPSLAELYEQVQRQQLLAAQRMLEDVCSWVDPGEIYKDNDDFRVSLGPAAIPGSIPRLNRGDDLPVARTWQEQRIQRDESRILCANNCFAICGAGNRINFACGKGFDYQFEHDSERIAQAAQDYLDTWRGETNWQHQEREILERCDRDGEAFLRFFPTADNFLELRYAESEWVGGGTGEGDPATSFGVVTAHGDLRDVQGYLIDVDPQSKGQQELVPAADVLHVKFNTDSSSKRGRPTFYPVRKHLERAEKLQRNMSILAQVQSTYAVIRKHSGVTASALQAYQAAQVDRTTTNPITGRTENIRQLPPGSIVDAFGNTEYQFPSSTVQADKYVIILQAELRAAAARLGMPEYMLSSDASNANYASTMVAESPAVQSFLHLQWLLAWYFGHGRFSKRHRGVMWRVLLHGVQTGQLKPDTLAGKVCVTPQNLVFRDRTKETQRRQVLYTHGILTREQWASEEGLDPDAIPAKDEIPNQQPRPGDPPPSDPQADDPPAKKAA